MESFTLRRTISNAARKPVAQITDRAKRYRANTDVEGPQVCVFCGVPGEMVLHLSGDESDGDKKNLAWGCRSCNMKLAAAWKALGSPVRTRQYNPAAGSPPTFQQYAWGVAHHSRGAHDEGGAIIHATPKHLRIKYAKRIAETRSERRDSVPF